MQPANAKLRRTRRQSTAAENLAFLRSRIDAGLAVPAGDYAIESSLVLHDNETLNMDTGAVIRPNGAFQGPLVVIAGSHVTINGGNISGTVPVDGWVDEGNGLWSAPAPPYNVGRTFSLMRNGERKRISKFPQMRKTPIGCLRHWNPEFKANTPPGSMDHTFAGGRSWTVATWFTAYYGLYTGALFQIGGETNIFPQGVRVQSYSQWNGTTSRCITHVSVDNKAQIIFTEGRSQASSMLVVLTYDADTKVLTLYLGDDDPVSAVVPGAGVQIPEGRSLTLLGNLTSATGPSTGGRGAFFSTLAAWNRPFSNQDRMALYNNRKRLLWPDVPQSLKDGCTGFWGFDRYDDMGHADVGPDLVPRGEFTPSCTHGVDDGTVGILPLGQYELSKSSTYTLGTTYPLSETWIPDAKLPGSEKDVWICQPSRSWKAIYRMDAEFDAQNNRVLRTPYISNFNTCRSIIFSNVKSSMEPGTFCSKLQDGKIYYMPEAGETIENSKFTVPMAAMLMARDGTPPGPSGRYDLTVPPYPLRSNLTFSGVRFDGARYHLSKNATLFASEGVLYYKQDVAVNMFAYLSQVLFENCVFENIETERTLSCDCHSDGFVISRCSFRNAGAGFVSFGTQPCEVVGSENKNTLIEYCEFENNGNVISATCHAISYGVVDGFVVRGNRFSNIVYNVIASQPWRSGTGGPIVTHTFKNTLIEGNHIYNFLTSASDGGAIYIGNGNKTTTRNGNNVIRNNLISDNSGYLYGRTGYGEHGIYSDTWGFGGWVIENNLLLNTLSAGILPPHTYGPSNIATIGGHLNYFVRDNMVSDDKLIQMPYYDFDPETMVEVVPRTQLTEFVEPTNLKFQKLYGTYGVADAASGNVSFQGRSFGPEANQLVADWLANNPVGPTAP